MLISFLLNNGKEMSNFCFNFRSVFTVLLISFLLNIGKEVSLPRFRRNAHMRTHKSKSYALLSGAISLSYFGSSYLCSSR